MTTANENLVLATRDGLPDALRVLIEDYPREAWERHPEFSGLIRFWLDRHLGFRRLLGALDLETRKMLDGQTEARAYGGRMARYGQMLVGELHGHHTIEDMHYFPRLRLLETRLDRGFDLLDGDHHALDAEIARFADAANTALRTISEGQPATDAVAAFARQLDGMSRLLDRHLEDEEDLVVPVLLKHAPADLT